MLFFFNAGSYLNLLKKQGLKDKLFKEY